MEERYSVTKHEQAEVVLYRRAQSTPHVVVKKSNKDHDETLLTVIP